MYDSLTHAFDCRNVSSPREHMLKRKPNLAPYTNVADIQFEVQICYALWELEAVGNSVSLICFYIHACSGYNIPGILNQVESKCNQQSWLQSD